MDNISRLLNEAQQASSRAYAPYSKFKVGCALQTPSGNVYSGCNVENVSYPVGMCAEAGAIAAMVNGGDNLIAQILIYADGKQLISPCGACRQRIVEFADKNTVIYLADKDGVKKTLSVDELLPYCFKEF